MDRKHCGKRRNFSLRAISPFPTVFSKDLYCKHVEKTGLVWEMVNSFSSNKLWTGPNSEHLQMTNQMLLSQQKLSLKEYAVHSEYKQTLFVKKFFANKRLLFNSYLVDIMQEEICRNLNEITKLNSDGLWIITFCISRNFYQFLSEFSLLISKILG